MLATGWLRLMPGWQSAGFCHVTNLLAFAG